MKKLIENIKRMKWNEIWFAILNHDKKIELSCGSVIFYEKYVLWFRWKLLLVKYIQLNFNENLLLTLNYNFVSDINY